MQKSKKPKSVFVGRTALLWAIIAIFVIGVIAIVFALNESGLVALKAVNIQTSGNNGGYVLIKVIDDKSKAIDGVKVVLVQLQDYYSYIKKINFNGKFTQGDIIENIVGNDGKTYKIYVWGVERDENGNLSGGGSLQLFLGTHPGKIVAQAYVHKEKEVIFYDNSGFIKKQINKTKIILNDIREEKVDGKNQVNFFFSFSNEPTYESVSKIGKTGETKQNGVYLFSKIPKGIHILMFFKKDFIQKTSQVSVLKNKTRSVKITLEKIPRTCYEQNATYCGENQYCSVESLKATDTNTCCPIPCDEKPTIFVQYKKPDDPIFAFAIGTFFPLPITKESEIDIQIQFLGKKEELDESTLKAWFEDDKGSSTQILLLKTIGQYGGIYYVGKISLSGVSTNAEFIKIHASILDKKGNAIKKTDRFNITKKQYFSCKKIVDNGPNENRINLFLVADGFSDISKFDEAILYHLSYNGEKMKEPLEAKGFFAIEPLKSNREKFNVFKISSTKKFGCLGFRNKVDENELGCNLVEVASLAGEVCGEKKTDLVLVLSNYKGLSWASFSGRAAVEINGGPTTTTHEMGHALGKLADEYWKEEFSYTTFNQKLLANQDSEGCPKWCSTSINNKEPCYQYYLQIKNCLEKYKSFSRENEEKMRDCWKENNQLSNSNLGKPIYDCALGLSCRKETQCYFTTKEIDTFRHIKNGIMNMGEEYRYGIISEEEIQKIIDSKTQQISTMVSGKRIEMPEDRIIWYDSFDEKGKIVSGGEINLTKMDSEKKAKLLAKTMELTKQISPSEREEVEGLIKSVTSPIKAKKTAARSNPRIGIVESVLDLEPEEVKLENINPSALIEAYLQTNVKGQK